MCLSLCSPDLQFTMQYTRLAAASQVLKLKPVQLAIFFLNLIKPTHTHTLTNTHFKRSPHNEEASSLLHLYSSSVGLHTCPQALMSFFKHLARCQRPPLTLHHKSLPHYSSLNSNNYCHCLMLSSRKPVMHFKAGI